MGKQEKPSTGIRRANENRESNERREAERNRERHGERRGRDTTGGRDAGREVNDGDRGNNKG